MKIQYLLLLFSLQTLAAGAQVNCNIYKWAGDFECHRACQIYETANHTRQGSRFSQILYDSVIAVCPSFDMAYMEKAVPYLKRGDFVTWRIWIDQAVALNPKEHLGYRGWCRYQFLRDCAGALADLEALEKIKQPNIGYSVNGDYHLMIAKALCHKGLGQKEKAIQTIEAQLAVADYAPGYYDYLHLAVLKIETGKPQEAISVLEKQMGLSSSFAEAHYYLALAYKQVGERRAQMLESLAEAKKLYQSGQHRTDPYSNPDDRIYREDIEKALAEW
ncbi:MAG: tetratricopeptide repeat protein [Saprospiraceae bacterium]